MAFGLAYDFDEDAPLPPALAAKPTHGFFEATHEHAALGLEHTRGMGQRIGDVIDHLEDFFWALYSVVASVTRWLPCSAGNVSMRT